MIWPKTRSPKRALKKANEQKRNMDRGRISTPARMSAPESVSTSAIHSTKVPGSRPKVGT